MEKVNKDKTNNNKKMLSVLTHIVSGFGSAVFSLFALAILWFMIFNVHPSNNNDQDNGANGRMDLISKIQTIITDTKSSTLSDYLSENQIIRKIYKIEEGDPVPAPNPSCYGTVEIADASRVMDVIDQARECGLLEGQDVVFSPDIDFYKNSNIQYYFDETILVIVWKEVIEGQVLSMSEIKIADASQFRRKLAGDSYGSGRQYFCSELTRQANAVVGLNADFYAFRALGITCYEGTIYRTNNTLDTMFVDNNGDFIFYERGQNASKEELQKFVDDRNISFGLSFGPILIKDGQLINCPSYPIGETNQTYTRAGIGMLDNLHYLFMDIENHGYPTVTVNTFGRFMYEKGVINGYNLDGGQTAEIVFNNKVYNFVNYGNERDVSDIIYFATALVEEQ